MIGRQVLMHAIAHNQVRAVMLQSARTREVPLRRVSFKGLSAHGQTAPPHVRIQVYTTKINGKRPWLSAIPLRVFLGRRL